jgi:hypothetical protein
MKPKLTSTLPAADNALEFQIVTAQGRFVTANAEENPDLYWALKGGGPGAFAVVLSATVATFNDLPSAGIILNINSTHTTDLNLFWSGVRLFSNYSNHFVDSGLYASWSVRSLRLHVQPLLGINQTAAQLNAAVSPLLREFDNIGLKYDAITKEFKSFFDLYIDVFEDEGAGQPSLTGGWTFTHEDIKTNNNAIVDAYKNALDNGGIVVGHIWDAGHGKGMTDSAVNPRFRKASVKVITALPVAANATLADKAKAQNTLTNVIDEGLRKAGPNGCAYVNEVSSSHPPSPAVWRLTISRPTRISPTGNRDFGERTTQGCTASGRNGIPKASSTPCQPLGPRTGRSSSSAHDSARNSSGPLVRQQNKDPLLYLATGCRREDGARRSPIPRPRRRLPTASNEPFQTFHSRSVKKEAHRAVLAITWTVMFH